MIPCTLRPHLLLNNALRYSLQKNVGSTKFFTTENRNPNASNESDNLGQDPVQHLLEEEIDKEEEKHFWEIDNKNRGYENRRLMEKAPEVIHKGVMEFRGLLDNLFPSIKSGENAPLPPVKPLPQWNKRGTTVIEQKLLDMVTQNKKPFKQKAPLPRTAMGAMYGKMTGKKQRQEEVDENEDILDFLNPSSTGNWNKQAVLSNENIQLKEKEMKAIQSIVDTTNELELLQCIQKEINQDDYPAYYPNVLAKAIEHASLKDPYLALAIFEQAKNKSMKSYIIGCTTTVYNRLLMLRWEIWRDVYGMVDLVEEMTLNGIVYDNDSRRIIRSIVNEIESEGSSIDQDTESTGVYWSAEERRNCLIMRELAGKWLITKS